MLPLAVLGDSGHLPRDNCSGGRTRTPNIGTRTRCVAYYTTPEGNHACILLLEPALLGLPFLGLLLLGERFA